MARRNDKRSRLIQAADKLFHEQGVNTTTLANIAQLADVPLGNVYYYFKSKESIVLAVFEHLRKQLQQQLEEINVIQDSKARLQALIRSNGENSEQTAMFGDKLGSLCQELGRQGGETGKAAADLMNDLISWIEKQFISLGKTEKAKALAVNLASALQGTSLLTLTFKDQNLVNDQSAYMVEWLETV